MAVTLALRVARIALAPVWMLCSNAFVSVSFDASAVALLVLGELLTRLLSVLS